MLHAHTAVVVPELRGERRKSRTCTLRGVQFCEKGDQKRSVYPYGVCVCVCVCVVCVCVCVCVCVYIYIYISAYVIKVFDFLVTWIGKCTSRVLYIAVNTVIG